MDETRFEVGTEIGFRSSHVMPGVEGPEGVLHEHEYRVEVVVSKEALDDKGMVCDLDVLDAALADLRKEVEGRDLEVIRPPESAAVTVEVFAQWALVGEGGTLAVRVWESDVAFGGFRGPLP
jgi:6-pyruvoyl-tetrahydropterin synthase